ncbi:MAG TPA: hypothetical protein VFA88_09560 [Gaiellaceae bacterium]|nr:hypothetical protein [Gaiellaceae bacterium]
MLSAPKEGMVRTFVFSLVAVAVVAWAAAPALAGGGDYVIVGGSAYEQQQVRLALQASAFDWNAVPARVTITIAPNVVSQSLPGRIWLDANLLDSGRFAWGVVQNEYAHQVDFYLLSDAQRQQLTIALGASAWCYGDQPGLTLAQTGCERFASTLAVAYWPSADNCISRADDVAPIAPAGFRALLASLIGTAAMPTTSLSSRRLTFRR